LRTIVCLALCLAASPLKAQTGLPVPFITGLKNPESVVIGPDRGIYISVIGEFGKDGDGAIMKVVDGKAVPFATGLDDPKGLASSRNWLFAADKDRIWRIDKKGKAEVFVAAKAFPSPPLFLNDLVADAFGNLYVSDSGDLKGSGGAIYRVSPKGKVTLITDYKKTPALKAPNGLALDSESHLLVLDLLSGELLRIRLADGATAKVADGFDGGDGLAFDWYGRLYISSWKNGTVHVIPRPGAKPVLLASGFQSAADLCLDPSGQFLLVPDMKAGTVTRLSSQVPGQEIDETPLALDSVVAFPDLEWTGWKGETAAGLPNPLRPVLLTHAGDGTNRVFVCIQQGTIHVFPNDQKAKKTKVFLDIAPKVLYQDKENETGFLGLAFPPDYKAKGEFYIFYTLKDKKLTNVLSRFRVSKDDPDRADPASEEILLEIQRPFWNHDGGTLVFGPDGYLYVALGDGGAANDPFGNGQNLKTLLGGVLRIDVSRKENGLPYAIPQDNPFVGRADARPEKWAYGLRNVWRMSFDRKTGKLWAADVGQNLYEEINILKAGGNYGWNLREGLHPFGFKGVTPRDDLIEPIWEYNHDIGKSITGGHVYRGKRLPELDGAYLYADYVSNFIRALRYDEAKGRVVANQPIRDHKLPVLSFGEDERGEVYYMTYTPSGQGIYWFVRTGDARR
jgi:glucose/arabinose dehydrogenase